MTFLKYVIVFLVLSVLIVGCTAYLGEKTRHEDQSGNKVNVTVEEATVMSAEYFDSAVSNPISVTLVSEEAFLIDVDGEKFDSIPSVDAIGSSRRLLLNPGQVLTIEKAETTVQTTMIAERPFELDVTHPFGTSQGTSGTVLFFGILIEIFLGCFLFLAFID